MQTQSQPQNQVQYPPLGQFQPNQPIQPYNYQQPPPSVAISMPIQQTAGAPQDDPVQQPAQPMPQQPPQQSNAELELIS